MRGFVIILICLLEGGSLLGFEILSSKLFAPFLGTTIQVWAAILSVTLLALAFGYRYGGRLVSQGKAARLHLHLIVAGVIVFFSSQISHFLLPYTLSLPTESAAIIASLLILFPVVFLLGTVSPLLVSLFSSDKGDTANGVSIIYGLGTLSGIVFVLLGTFVLVPFVGLKMTLYIFGILLILAGVLSKTVLFK
jgi:predicted membrane-bound spermidine synthase